MATLADPIFEFIIEFLIGQAIRRGPKVFKTVRRQLRMPRLPKRFFVSQVGLVNRESELEAIQGALAEERHLRIIYLFGSGGVGKTRLLEEVESLVKKVKVKSTLCWSGILDLYHPDLRSVVALKDLIVQNLDPAEQHFQQYRQARSRFDQLRAGGSSRPGLDRQREELNKQFLNNYNQFTQKCRPILTFDTLESLSPESDLIQTFCQLEEPSIATRDWLLKEVSNLNNTVILLAGRPQPSFDQDLKRAYGGEPGRLETIFLKGLTRKESRQLLERFLKGKSPIFQELFNQADLLHELTKGLPVLQTLIVELLVFQNKYLDLNKAKGADHFTWGRYLVDTLFEYDDPHGRLFFLLAIARRGLTVDLLHYLEPDWSKQACEERLTGVKNLSIVKTRRGSDETFLHDALYELFDAYSPARELLDPWYERLIDYYRAQQIKAGDDRVAWGKVTVKRLYYELQRNPRQVFETWYLRWDDIVISGREAELDVQLRDEFLRFIHSSVNQERIASQGLTRSLIEQYSAVRWVKRFVAHSRYPQAIDLAQTILSLAPKPYCAWVSEPTAKLADMSPKNQADARKIFEPAPPLFWGQLLTYYGNALTVTGASEDQAEQILTQAIALLNKPLQEEKAIAWLRERVLGKAHNVLGYLLRYYGHYGRALAAYEQARSHFETFNVDFELADTLNNLSFLMAILGDSKQAKDCIDQALAIRQRLGQPFPLALSHNTRGLIYALHRQLGWAEQECKLALRIFQDIESSRGIGLAYNALGYIMRQHGEGWKTNRCDQDQASNLFQRAIEYLGKSAHIFTEIIEPIRLWESFSEQGSVYCDWGHLLKLQGNTASASQKWKQAITCHSRALEIAQQHDLHFQEADSCDDLAQTLADQGNLDQARQWLLQGLSLVPPKYILKPGAGFKDASESGENYWLILGKAHLQQGIWALKSVAQNNLSKTRFTEKQQEGVEHFALATAYFQRYWPNTNMMNQRLRSMSRYLKQAGISSNKSRSMINQLSSHYAIDLTVLLEIIESD